MITKGSHNDFSVFYDQDNIYNCVLCVIVCRYKSEDSFIFYLLPSNSDRANLIPSNSLGLIEPLHPEQLLQLYLSISSSLIGLYCSLAQSIRILASYVSIILEKDSLW